MAYTKLYMISRDKAEWNWRKDLPNSALTGGEELLQKGVPEIQLGEDGRSGSMVIRNFYINKLAKAEDEVDKFAKSLRSHMKSDEEITNPFLLEGDFDE